jgi:hypothetical protein
MLGTIRKIKRFFYITMERYIKIIKKVPLLVFRTVSRRLQNTYPDPILFSLNMFFSVGAPSPPPGQGK